MRIKIKKYIIIAVFFLSAVSLFCRDITIQVLDGDLELPLEGATVRTRGGNEYVCGRDGKVKVPVPDDRQTILYASYPGYETNAITIPITENSFIVSLNLSSFFQGRELVVEASKPGTSETKTGRSVAVSEKEIAQTAEIGVIEDVMNTIKLLPGVGYTGLFNAEPSIRGGQPGDMMASLDGFYINSPYFWGGGFSIFDPRMVKSAQLSHGVFSTRYGHTISGLLEITSREPSTTETEFELGVNTSAANFNLSLPLNGKGGVLFMGRVTYYDPVIWGAKELSKIIPELEVINYLRTAPFIRAGTINGNYRFTDNLVISATGFFGMDGGGVLYQNESRTSKLNSDTSIDVDYVNYQTFLTSSISWNPHNDMLLKFTVGAGYEDSDMDGIVENKIHNKYFTDDFPPFIKLFLSSKGKDPEKYQYYNNMHMVQTDTKYNIQGRVDYDWKLSNNFLAAVGAQELFSVSETKGDQQSSRIIPFDKITDETIQNNIKGLFPPNTPLSWLLVEVPMAEKPNSQNKLITTSGYLLGEFNTDGNRFGAELGVRMDHFILLGDGFTLQSDPVFNPRINLDFNILRNKGIFNSIDISAGTGLFSSINDTVFDAEKKYNLDRIKPNRSWTSVLGVKFDLPESLTINVEGYYKKVFDRMYVLIDPGNETVKVDPYFDGEGMIWGVDVMLQKIQNRFWDGWLSYSYNWAKYREPNGKIGGMVRSGGNRGDDWYFPSYHRFHNLNLILNVKPTQKINIYTRLGIASGGQFPKRDENGPKSSPVLIYNGTESYFIEEFFWNSVMDENNRTTPSLSMDIKISFFGGNKNGKTRYEFYFAVENALGLLYTPQGNTSYNNYTGEINEGGLSASYDIPIPIPSFGFKISY